MLRLSKVKPGMVKDGKETRTLHKVEDMIKVDSFSDFKGWKALNMNDFEFEIDYVKERFETLSLKALGLICLKISTRFTCFRCRSEVASLLQLILTHEILQLLVTNISNIQCSRCICICSGKC